MNEIDLLNILFIYFNKQQHSNMLLVQNLDQAFRGMADGLMPNVNIERLCEQLYKDGFIYREVSYPNSGLQTNRYSISTNGILHFENLPLDYNSTPYTYYLVLVKEELKKKEQKEKLERDSIQANIDVSKSVEATNTINRSLAGDTTTFYKNQRRTNKINIFLTIAIFMSSAIYTAVSILSYTGAKSDSLKEKRLDQLEDKLQSHTTQDSIFQKAIKDSLKMK